MARAPAARGALGVRLPQCEELIEGVRPKDLLVLIADVNAGPAKAHEVGSLEHGACGGDPNEFRMIAVRMFTVDGKYGRPFLPATMRPRG
jgi:hypothetical protein